ncbi:hypothetical protein BJX62DRAFT_245557 [Aspergillus germanicus]
MNTSTASPDGIDVHLLVEDGFDLSTVGRDFNLSSREDLERATALTDGKGRYTLHYTDPGIPVVHEDEISRIRRHVTKLGRGVLATQVDLLADRMYRGTVDKEKGYTLLQLHTFIQLKVPFVAKRADDWIRVRSEIVSIGEVHANPWARACRSDDPAARLRFQVINNKGQVEYPSTDTQLNVLKANSFVDWMAGETAHELASKPRRFIWICPGTSSFPPGIPGTGSYYTDDEGNIHKRRRGPEQAQ